MNFLDLTLKNSCYNLKLKHNLNILIILQKYLLCYIRTMVIYQNFPSGSVKFVQSVKSRLLKENGRMQDLSSPDATSLTRHLDGLEPGPDWGRPPDIETKIEKDAKPQTIEIDIFLFKLLWVVQLTFLILEKAKTTEDLFVFFGRWKSTKNWFCSSKKRFIKMYLFVLGKKRTVLCRILKHYLLILFEFNW